MKRFGNCLMGSWHIAGVRDIPQGIEQLINALAVVRIDVLIDGTLRVPANGGVVIFSREEASAFARALRRHVPFLEETARRHLVPADRRPYKRRVRRLQEMIDLIESAHKADAITKLGKLV